MSDATKAPDGELSFSCFISSLQTFSAFLYELFLSMDIHFFTQLAIWPIICHLVVIDWLAEPVASACGPTNITQFTATTVKKRFIGILPWTFKYSVCSRPRWRQD